jgi:uncharacterized protein YkwD
MVFLALLAASPCVQAQSDAVVRLVNRLRAPGGACAANAPALLARDALDAVATRLARGATLERAVKSVGYRPTDVYVITIAGAGLHSRLEALLVGRYCAQIGLPTLTEVGVHDAGNQLWIVLAAPFAPKVAMTRQQIAERTLALVNQARAKPRRCGDKPFGAARPLRWNEALASAASLHAADMAANNYFSHTGRDGSTSGQRVTRAGYRYRAAGENIAAGQLSPDEAVAGWLKSPVHCANVMNSLFTEMGVASAVSANSTMGVYWVQLFGRPM